VIKVDPRPAEADGPHNLNISPDGRYWYVSLAHGTPNGALWKFDTATDSLAGTAGLSRFPATISFSPDGEFAWVANFNLFGDMVPSSVSVVYTPAMQEVARIPTCLMPHGMRVARDGRRAWMTCMMDDKLVEMDPATYRVTRLLGLQPGRERMRVTTSAMLPGELDHAHGTTPPDAPASGCAPTWVQPASNGRWLYVACNRHSEVLEVDPETLGITRRIATGRTPYNLAISEDGRVLVATLKGAQALSVIDLDLGREVAQLKTTHTVPSGVQVTPDGRYAVVSCEGKGAEAGAVNLFDLTSRSLISSVEVGAGAGGLQILSYRP
jgi:DNA-binding beta-propeller fold protein YncE